MTNRFLTFILALFIISGYSCKKDSDRNYYIKFKMDGNWYTHTNVVGEYGPDLANPSHMDLVVNGNSDDFKQILSVVIQKENSSVIPPGTYFTDNNSYWASIDLIIDTNTGLQAYQTEDAPNMPPSKYTINITSVTAKEIRGNFTGNYLYDNMADKIKNVTEGEFVARRID